MMRENKARLFKVIWVDILAVMPHSEIKMSGGGGSVSTDFHGNVSGQISGIQSATRCAQQIRCLNKNGKTEKELFVNLYSDELPVATGQVLGIVVEDPKDSSKRVAYINRSTRDFTANWVSRRNRKSEKNFAAAGGTLGVATILGLVAWPFAGSPGAFCIFAPGIILSSILYAKGHEHKNAAELRADAENGILKKVCQHFMESGDIFAEVQSDGTLVSKAAI